MSEGSRPYRLSLSQHILAKLRNLADRAASNRRQQWFLDLLQDMNAGLTERPAAWGDPQYRYEHLNLLVYLRACELFSVSYAMDEGHKIVYVQDVRPMAGGGLDLVP